MEPVRLKFSKELEELGGVPEFGAIRPGLQHLQLGLDGDVYVIPSEEHPVAGVYSVPSTIEMYNLKGELFKVDIPEGVRFHGEATIKLA